MWIFASWSWCCNQQKLEYVECLLESIIYMHTIQVACVEFFSNGFNLQTATGKLRLSRCWCRGICSLPAAAAGPSSESHWHDSLRITWKVPTKLHYQNRWRYRKPARAHRNSCQAIRVVFVVSILLSFELLGRLYLPLSSRTTRVTKARPVQLEAVTALALTGARMLHLRKVVLVWSRCYCRQTGLCSSHDHQDAIAGRQTSVLLMITAREALNLLVSLCPWTPMLRLSTSTVLHLEICSYFLTQICVCSYLSICDSACLYNGIFISGYKLCISSYLRHS